MKISYGIMFCFLLVGCVVPNYHSHRQSLPLKDVLIIAIYKDNERKLYKL